jgi:hypothetical protein
MTNDFLTKIENPPADGLNKLRRKLDASEINNREETVFLGAVTGILVATLVVFLSFGSKTPLDYRSLRQIPSGSVQLVEANGTPPGIHYYWVFR